MRLIPCAACGRHLRSGEQRCPHCGAANEHDSERLRRAVVFALATSLGACSTRARDDVTPAPVVSASAAASASASASARVETNAGAPAGNDAMRTVAVYGAPIVPLPPARAVTSQQKGTATVSAVDVSTGARESVRRFLKALEPAFGSCYRRGLLLDADAQGRIDVWLAFASNGGNAGGNTSIEGRIPIQVLMCVEKLARATVVKHAQSGPRSVRFSITFVKG